MTAAGAKVHRRRFSKKIDLQALANRLGVKIRIGHYPPYCSKCNPIEHGGFPLVTRACKSVPLETIETANRYMEKNETTKGLNVVVRIVGKVSEPGTCRIMSLILVAIVVQLQCNRDLSQQITDTIRWPGM